MCRPSWKEALTARQARKFLGEREKKSSTDTNTGDEGEIDVLIQKNPPKHSSVRNFFRFNPKEHVGLQEVHPSSSLLLMIVLALSRESPQISKITINITINSNMSKQ